MNMKQELSDQLEPCQDARFFSVIEDRMSSKRESEILQHFIIEHGRCPRSTRRWKTCFEQYQLTIINGQ